MAIAIHTFAVAAIGGMRWRCVAQDQERSKANNDLHRGKISLSLSLSLGSSDLADMLILFLVYCRYWTACSISEFTECKEPIYIRLLYCLQFFSNYKLPYKSLYMHHILSSHILRYVYCQNTLIKPYEIPFICTVYIYIQLLYCQITNFPTNLYTCIIFHLHTYYSMCTAKIHLLTLTKSLLSFYKLPYTSLCMHHISSSHILYTMYIYCQNTPIKSFSSICFY